MSHTLEGSRMSVALPDVPICAIVKFRDDLIVGKEIPQNPSVHFQVTIRADKVSPSGRFIRFGETQGDELLGWMRRDYLEIVEVLGNTNIADGTVTPIAEAA